MSGEGAWIFAQAFYARPGVSQRLLGLQEERGVDIPLMLVLLHAAELGVSLETAAVQELMHCAEGWRREVVEPLRNARRALKQSVCDPAGKLYEQVKCVELSAEEIAIRELADILPERGKEPPQAAAAANLDAYRLLRGLPDGVFAPIVAAFTARAD